MDTSRSQMNAFNAIVAVKVYQNWNLNVGKTLTFVIRFESTASTRVLGTGIHFPFENRGVGSGHGVCIVDSYSGGGYR